MVRNAFGFASCMVLCFILFSLSARAATHSAGAEPSIFAGGGSHGVLDFDILDRDAPLRPGEFDLFASGIPSRSFTSSGDSFDFGLWGIKPIPFSAAPAPGSAVLFAVGLTILGATRRKRRRSQLLSRKLNNVTRHLDPGLHDQSESGACATEDAGGGVWKRIQRSKRD
ncbi:MAG: hypothetical protein IH973_04540 [Myxococcales bacterium]|nr:hypothetical protein [Myxococcales bacterium]